MFCLIVTLLSHCHRLQLGGYKCGHFIWVLMAHYMGVQWLLVMGPKGFGYSD
jgi:hypothetical protein